MKWICENYSLLIIIAIVVLYFVLSGKKSVINWLLYFVCKAEQHWGSGTGQLKLAEVYSEFISNYPVLSKIIPFTVFSLWVDEVLVEMRRILETNKDIEAYISGDD